MKKYSHVYLHIPRAHAQFREKQTFFVSCAKKLIFSSLPQKQKKFFPYQFL
jgi:hypothetical protein